MTTLTDGTTPRTLERLHAAADVADADMRARIMAAIDAPGATIEQFVAQAIADERADYGRVYRGHADHFLAISADYGRFLYAMARATQAKRIVEFGTSMGISTIYLAAALRDNGGGALIGSEIEPAKAARARAHLAEAGLGDLVDVREGDALETLRDIGGAIDLVLLDGAFSLYLPVLRLIEPALRPGAIILSENAFDPLFVDYVRDPANGYISQPMPIDEGRGNELTVKVA